jgi:kumamolisin
MINQARFAAGKSALGPLNPHIYRLVGTANFRDTTQGCNGGFCAGPGYDLVTGLGSPVMNVLVPTLRMQN